MSWLIPGASQLKQSVVSNIFYLISFHNIEETPKSSGRNNVPRPKLVCQECSTTSNLYKHYRLYHDATKPSELQPALVLSSPAKVYATMTEPISPQPKVRRTPKLAKAEDNSKIPGSANLIFTF